ncbi:thiamine phosphate synthase [Chelativorans sp. Marseille-P2723]|uniref:thiamine phosphate synthase n=1 Tax=Chelativorans sp. Marseille-P2723 TaxID=2709133 RepID=UPI00156FE381|nr:thiamine phosphate synthase [Chelativorans sp. Marseille-P2723]
MSETPVPNRCRVVLIAPPMAGDSVERVGAALTGGDVASLIIPAYSMNEADFQTYAEQLTRRAQEVGVAVMVAGEPRIAARVRADGIHVEASKAKLGEVIAKYHPKMMVGCGGAKSRDDALELGEVQPDYIFFGRFGYDVKPEPHPRNIALGEWWSQMIRIPCIVLAGSQIASVVEVARTGADFVALGEAVFGPAVLPQRAIGEANALLDRHAPSFSEAGS